MTEIQQQQKTTHKLAKMGMLTAIAFILANIQFPIFPAVPYMQYDPADIPILLGTFALGPLGGLCITIIASILEGVVASSGGPYGVIMHIVATGTYALVAGIIYKHKKSKKSAIIALVCATLAMTLIMIPANYIVTPAFTGMPRSGITAILPYIIAFNFIKAGANAIITFFVYKRVSNFLHK